MLTRLGVRFALIAALCTLLPACSWVASLFPDKQKQYRYSTDLPPLEIPPDLSSSTIEGAKESGSPVADGEREEAPPADLGGTDESERPEPPAASKRRAASKQTASSAATLAQNTEDTPLIEIEEPFAEAWNDVNRALGRLEIEVTDQNRSDAVYFVNYGGSTRKPKENSGLWDDVKSLFAGGSSDGKNYKIKLEEKDNFTNIYVFDDADKPVSTGPGFELLKRLHEKLKSLDQTESEPAESESEKDR